MGVGVDLSIDEFGTGYSSLSYLKLFPVDGVKVDRVFVDGLGTDPHDTALVAAIVAIATALDLEVTAEGVETHEQLRGLKALGVPRAQGFYLAARCPLRRSPSSSPSRTTGMSTDTNGVSLRRVARTRTMSPIPRHGLARATRLPTSSGDIVVGTSAE